MRRIKNILVAVFASMIVLFVSIPTQAQEDGKTDYNFESVKNLDIFHSLYKELYLYYVDPVEPEKLIKTAIDKMLDCLECGGTVFGVLVIA